MIRTKNREPYFLLFLLTLIVLTGLTNCRSNPKDNPILEKRKQRQTKSLSKNIGEQFSLSNFIDTNGRSVQLDFTKSDITIVDFWFNECPPCNEEMRQFKDLIKGKDKEITIVSISVSNYQFWKDLFLDSTKKYAFLKNSIPNWQHLNLKSNDDPKLKHLISEDRLEELTSVLNVSFFPSYFVIDKSGFIRARPISAVEYIKHNKTP